MCMHVRPIRIGIQIPDEVFQRYSEKLKAHWETFHNWWQSVEGSVSKDDMPEDVLEAYLMINEVEIPGTGQPGAASCYMMYVNNRLKKI